MWGWLPGPIYVTLSSNIPSLNKLYLTSGCVWVKLCTFIWQYLETLVTQLLSMTDADRLTGGKLPIIITSVLAEP